MFQIKNIIEKIKSIPRGVKILLGVVAAAAVVFCVIWFGWAETAVITVISLALFLSVIVIHEVGHYSFARIFDVKIIEFAVGMGPKLWGKRGKKHDGETLYTVRALPIGGFCLMEGEDGDDSGEDADEINEEPSPRAFFRKKPWQRALILSAGAIFNILLGFVFMLIVQAQQPFYPSNTIAAFWDPLVSEEEYEAAAGSDVYYTEEHGGVTYYRKKALSPDGGLRVGDTILAVNGSRTLCFNDVYFSMSMSNDGVVDFTVLRGGRKVEVEGVAFYRETDPKHGIDYTVLDFRVERIERNLGTVISQTWYQSVFMMKSVYVSLWRMISGQGKLQEMSGPVAIASMIGEVAKQGFAESVAQGVNNTLSIMALITFNLGVFNLLPFPALDGGRLMFILLEAIRRKPVPAQYERIIHAVGFILLIGLMILVTFKDLVSCFSG